MGLNYYTLADWRKLRKNDSLPETEAQKRIRQLEKEIAELQRANDILKDALGFFTKDRKK